MEASALPRPTAIPRPRLAVPVPVLRLHSDDQLVALFRAGSDDAFRAIHDRYRVRLLAYAAQMLGGSRADAEDALQDVFVRAHQALRSSRQPIMLRAWLYRIAHNRCVDQLRRPAPIPSEIMPGAQLALSRGARHDPPAEAERSEDLRRLVADVHSLPEQQRSALLMRELQGLSYEELGCALGISVAGVKSLLLRARGGVLDAAAARDTPCADIRLELASAHDRGVRASGRARRHMRECGQCSSYRGELRSVSRQVAALVPVGPLGHLGLLFGIGGGGGASAGAGGGIAASSSSALLGGAASVTATKVAAIVCACALVGGAGALQATAPSSHHKQTHTKAHTARHTTSYVPPAPSPSFVAHTAGGTIAPAPPTTRSAAATVPTTPSELTGPDQLALSSAAAGVTDPTSATPGLATGVTGADPTSTTPGVGAVLPGDPTASTTTPGDAQTAASGAPDPSSVQTTGSAGQTAPLSDGQAAAASAGASPTPSQTNSTATAATAPASPATLASATTTSSGGSPGAAATATAAALAPQATVASTSSPTADTHEADAVHGFASTRITGGTYSIGAMTFHWQHRSRAGSPHRSAPQQHYLTVSSLH
jgi:RNA polymerase sigma factor (sigma-70 family)